MNPKKLPDVGARLRALRDRRGLSLRSLAEVSNLSPNTISLIERGVSSPSVATLHRLAIGLGVPITSFFKEKKEKEEVILTRAGERPCSKSASVLLESLGSGLQDQTLEPFVVTLKPGADSGRQIMVHAGHELVYCLQGEIEYEVGGQYYRLAVGDALLFEARLTHRWRNPCSEPAKCLMVLQTSAPDESVQQHLRP
jgi:transcriptional regulator with XRE-family HTH domain